MKTRTMKPMLAATASLVEIQDILRRTPLLVTSKLDGIRCIIKAGQPLSRSFKPIPNLHISTTLARKELWGLDGELIVGEIGSEGQFQETSSAVMSRKGKPEFTYHVFDLHDQDHATYQERVSKLFHYEDFMPSVIKAVSYIEVATVQDLIRAEERFLRQGYEGLILRHPQGRYKWGRSTVPEAAMLKFKRFEDSEGVVIGYEAEMHNSNMSHRDELGRTKRTSHREGLIAKNTLGSLTIRDDKKEWEFGLGTGFSQADRARLWAMGDGLLGKTVKYKFFPIGVKDGPRFPVFLGFRDKRDM